MKQIWILTSSEGTTAWSTLEKAQEARTRQMTDAQSRLLRSAIDDLARQEDWESFLSGESSVQPAQKIWETSQITPEKLAWPMWRRETLEALRQRIVVQKERIAEFEIRLRNIMEGHDYSDEWGYQIKAWTLDTDEIQGEEYYD